MTNLTLTLNKQFKVFVITSSHDLNLSKDYDSIIINQWNEVNIFESKNTINVFYTQKRVDRQGYLKLFCEVQPTIVYLNNIYSYHFFRLPLQTLENIKLDYRIIVCPRGMLQQGALGLKPFKKKIYLAYLRLTGLLNKVYWHATNEEEENDIKKHFKKNKGVLIAPNIPKSPIETISYPIKQKGKLQMIFLSLITQKKNLLFLLQVILTSDKNICLDIYGPVTDKAYWQQCESIIKQMPEKVQYKGEVQPPFVQQVLSQYHAFILPTKGENFGHALYESLSAGRPVITSYFTPWNDLKKKKAGVNLDISNMQDCIGKLHDFADLNQEEYNGYCEGAYQLARQYYQNLNAEVKYSELFG